MMRYDFAILNNNRVTYFIEFDGEQHFHPVEHFGGKEYFQYIQRNDLIKNQWCKNNNIPLIRILYTKLNNLKIQDLLLTSQYIL